MLSYWAPKRQAIFHPYFSGWWVTVGAGQFAAMQLRRRRDLAAFFLGHELGDAIWYVFVAIVLVTGRAWLTDEVYQGLIMICGLSVGLLAVFFVFLGARSVRVRGEA